MNGIKKILTVMAFMCMMLITMSGAAFADTINITVALGTPADNTYSSSTNLNFTFTPVSNNTILNATIWSTWEDGSTWAANQTNVSEVINNTLNGIT